MNMKKSLAAVSMWQVTRPNPMWFDHVLTVCLPIIVCANNVNHQ
jgi:hypothetical protein